MKDLLKRIQKLFKQKKGFTLIELLVVIGILGILVASLLITIDPFEQLKKGRDTTTRGAAVDYLNAMTRYYATHGVLPWDFIPAIGATCAKPTTAKLLNDASIAGCTTALTNEGELKPGFATSMTDAGTNLNIKVLSVNAGADLRIGFSPTSKSMKSENATIYDTTLLLTPAGCATAALRATSADLICWQIYK